MIRTRVGYSGGSKRNPTYYNLGDHSEAVQIDYNPERISYAELLTVFWASHNPVHRSWSSQYRAAIFYHNEEQKQLALGSLNNEIKKRTEKIRTEVRPFTGFTIAEDYHQKYHLRNEILLLDEFHAMYPDEKDLVNSTAAARVNGYLGGYGTPEDLIKELHDLGLSHKGKEVLLSILSSSRPAFKSCPVR